MKCSWVTRVAAFVVFIVLVVLALVAATATTAAASLRRLQTLDVDVILGGREDAPAGKPSQEFFETRLATLGATLVVGASMTDPEDITRLASYPNYLGIGGPRSADAPYWAALGVSGPLDSEGDLARYFKDLRSHAGRNEFSRIIVRELDFVPEKLRPAFVVELIRNFMQPDGCTLVIDARVAQDDPVYESIVNNFAVKSMVAVAVASSGSDAGTDEREWVALGLERVVR
jgi:hypothetical protein